MPESPYAWLGDVESFLKTPETELFSNLTRFSRETGAPQVFAWDRSLSALREQLGSCMPTAAGFGLILEFELPRSGGRRPDLIILENGTVLVIEFKNRVAAEPSDIDQVWGYKRDLEDYHAGCADRTLIPILVPIGMAVAAYEERGVRIVGPKGLGALIRELAGTVPKDRANPEGWAGAPYQPLPALVEAARLLFERKPLPRIRRADSARIPETVRFIESLVRDDGKRLVLLSGAPGAGKTLVGLQLVHSRDLGIPSLFLSGNGPLIQVLQYALDSKEFVQDMHSFLREHLIRRPGPPGERVIVFDEAQRAWDRDRVLQKHRGLMSGSEPELLLRLCEQVPGGSSLVALIGEGQEIHAGEESGIAQWADALSAIGDHWEVAGPPHLEPAFRSAGIQYDSSDLLNLTASLRSHRGLELARWTELLLDGRLEEARAVAKRLRDSGFAMWTSRNLAACKSYLRERYASEPMKKYGMIASSKDRKLYQHHGVDVVGFRFYHYGEWYEGSAQDRWSCRKLEHAVSEFGCQGLELDMPLVCWGPDLAWEPGERRWAAKVGRPRLVRDPQRLRLNAYRVLLTRGRDGIVVFVPPEQNDTNSALAQAGLADLARPQ